MNLPTWIRVSHDQVVSTTPAYISGFVLTDDGNGNADVTIYDGESTADPLLLKVKTLQYSTKDINFTIPLKTQRGIYVDIGSNVNELLVCFSWEHE